MTLKPLEVETAAEWLDHLSDSDIVLLYKHSTRCGVSLDAIDAVEELAREDPALPIFQVDVIRQRRLSDELARALGVSHASPQVILLRGRQPFWHTSHQRIRLATLTAQLEAARRR